MELSLHAPSIFKPPKNISVTAIKIQLSWSVREHRFPAGKPLDPRAAISFKQFLYFPCKFFRCGKLQIVPASFDHFKPYILRQNVVRIFSD